MTAIEKLNAAVPGTEWTLEAIEKLAKELIGEMGDLTSSASYNLVMLVIDPDIEEDVSNKLYDLRQEYWTKLGKTPPKLGLSI
jgi:hypothetical protein